MVQIVAESLDSEHILDHMFCNVHPKLMFNKVVNKRCAEIENMLGKFNIYSNILVNATTTTTSITEQALDCMTRLINHDLKPSKKSNEFYLHIAPRPNKYVNLKD